MSHILKKYSRQIDYSHDIVEIIESQHFFASNCGYIAKNRAVALAASERNAVVMLSDVRRCQVCKTLAASGRIDLAARQGTSAGWPRSRFSRHPFALTLSSLSRYASGRGNMYIIFVISRKITQMYRAYSLAT